jgi:hypothetical protein
MSTNNSLDSEGFWRCTTLGSTGFLAKEIFQKKILQDRKRRLTSTVDIKFPREHCLFALKWSKRYSVAFSCVFQHLRSESMTSMILSQNSFRLIIFVWKTPGETSPKGLHPGCSEAKELVPFAIHQPGKVSDRNLSSCREDLWIYTSFDHVQVVTTSVI